VTSFDVTNLNPWNIKVQINELLVELSKTEIGLGPRVRISKSGATHGKSTKSVIIPTKPREKRKKKRHKLPPVTRQYCTHPPPVYHAN
jgi:hypothetical protein